MTESNTVGTVTSFNPNDRTITVESSHFTRPIKYVLNSSPRYVNQSGQPITPSTAIQNGTSVELGFTGDGTVDRVMVVNRVAK